MKNNVIIAFVAALLGVVAFGEIRLNSLRDHLPEKVSIAPEAPQNLEDHQGVGNDRKVEAFLQSQR